MRVVRIGMVMSVVRMLLIRRRRRWWWMGRIVSIACGLVGSYRWASLLAWNRRCFFLWFHGWRMFVLLFFVFLLVLEELLVVVVFRAGLGDRRWLVLYHWLWRNFASGSNITGSSRCSICESSQRTVSEFRRRREAGRRVYLVVVSSLLLTGAFFHQGGHRL
jgi:hypothetical protein